MNIPYGMAVQVAITRWKTITDNDDANRWSSLDDTTRGIFVDMAKVWVQATADTGLLARATSYQAVFDESILGHYTTRASAQDHCERVAASRHGTDLDAKWVQDEPDADPETCAAELWLRNGDSVHFTELYVRPIPLLTAFDPTLVS